jgi:hypothetical protein
LLALALVLTLAGPARATLRYATFSWTPASGPVEGYAVYLSVAGGEHELFGWVPGPSAAVLFPSSVDVTLRVAAYEFGGHLGPLSDASEPKHLCPGDFNGDDIIGISDAGALAACFGGSAWYFCSGGDLNLDGLVGIVDFGMLRLGQSACPPLPQSEAPAVCAGDFNGDGVIGITDYHALNRCLGQLPVEACAAGDLDGNGTIDENDLDLAAASFGSEVCAP